MNYSHAYHAGNFADVFKHLILVALLGYLKQKDKPFCYVETHAGAGLYDLSAQVALKNSEFKGGIEALMRVNGAVPALIAQYLKLVKAHHYPHYYPGSPLIAQALLRENDQSVLSEMHPPVFRLLKKHVPPLNTAIHCQDGFAALKAFLPPTLSRALILIDPPYEKDDWRELTSHLPLALKRFNTGVYAIWFPVKDFKAVERWLNRLKGLDLPKVVVVEWRLHDGIHQHWGLSACGMVIINGPWDLPALLEPTLKFLCKHLGQGSPSFRIRNL